MPAPAGVNNTLSSNWPIWVLQLLELSERLPALQRLGLWRFALSHGKGHGTCSFLSRRIFLFISARPLVAEPKPDGLSAGRFGLPIHESRPESMEVVMTYQVIEPIAEGTPAA